MSAPVPPVAAMSWSGACRTVAEQVMFWKIDIPEIYVGLLDSYRFGDEGSHAVNVYAWDLVRRGNGYDWGWVADWVRAGHPEPPCWLQLEAICTLLAPSARPAGEPTCRMCVSGDTPYRNAQEALVHDRLTGDREYTVYPCPVAPRAETQRDREVSQVLAALDVTPFTDLNKIAPEDVLLLRDEVRRLRRAAGSTRREDG